MDTAGFPAFKAGRQLFRAGAVSGCSYEKGLLRGVLRSGQRQQVAGLKINAPTDVDNLCKCPRARREGAMCEHSIAVAFAWMDLEANGGTASVTAPQNASAAPGAEADRAAGKGRRMGSSSPLKVASVHIEKDFIKIWEKGKFPIRLSTVELAVDDPCLNTETLAAGARFSAWLAKNGADPASPPPFLVLDRGQAMDFLAALRDYPWLHIGTEQVARVVSEPIRPPLRIEWLEEVDGEDEASVDDVNVALRIDLGQELGENPAATLLSAEDSGGHRQAWIFDAATRAFTAINSSRGDLGGLMASALASRDRHGYGDAVAWPLRAVIENLEALNEQFVLDPEPLGVPLRLTTATPTFELSLEGSLNSLTAQLVVLYATSSEPLRLAAGLDTDTDGRSVQAFPIADAAQWGLYWQRNMPLEAATLELLQASGFKAADDRGRWVLHGRAPVMAFFGSALPDWYERGDVEVSLGERLVHVTRGLERFSPKIEVQAAGDSWFECQFAFESASGVSLSESEIRKLMVSGRREVSLSGRSGNGRGMDDAAIGVIDTDAVNEWTEVLQDVDAKQIRPGFFRIAAHHREYLEASVDADKECKNTTQLTINESVGDLIDVLREYQSAGVEWLCRRLLSGGIHGAVLADEMGLGKTVQTLAAIRALRQLGGEEFSGRPALVVAPTSLLSNWAAEAKKFTSELEVIVLHGSQRKQLFRKVASADLVITSYGVLARDTDALSALGCGFGLMVLDEASYIRNPKTQAARSVRKINAAGRVALTGTPVENSVRDLWSILDFVVPGCLGGREEFKQRYEAALGSERPSPEIMARLKRRVQPHLLRRTKRNVVRELPDKIEQVLFCDLTSAQKGLYAQLVDSSRETVRQALGKSGGGAGQARMAVLTTLLRLRQVCCDPRLLESGAGKQAKDTATAGSAEDSGLAEIGSAKLDLLLETLHEAREGGHRVLVFSQFVSMLKLIGDELSKVDCGYAYLDGSCSAKQRAAQVNRFQTDESVPVFLISLKAGGYGLNLTAADTVIHFDPWWNPAVEAQATDRAHRIGQERPVTSYKLICRGTVEEKILKLQQRKSAAFGGTIGGDDEVPMMNGLSDEELREVMEL